MVYLDFLGIFIDFLIKLCYLEMNEATNKKKRCPTNYLGSYQQKHPLFADITEV